MLYEKRFATRMTPRATRMTSRATRMTPRLIRFVDGVGNKIDSLGDKNDAVGRHSCARIPHYIKKNTGHHSCRQDNKNDAKLPTRMWIKLTNMATNLVSGPICSL